MTDIRTLKRHRFAVAILMLGSGAAFTVNDSLWMSIALALNSFVWFVAWDNVRTEIRRAGKLDITTASARPTKVVTTTSSIKGDLMDKN